MNRYGPKAQGTIKQTMWRYKQGKLRMGKSFKTVKDKKQALAIAISEAKRKRQKVPKIDKTEEGR